MPRILTQEDVAGFRNRLCETATVLFAEVGQGGFNMRALAKRLGVSAMTPYRYFEDKDSILSEVRARAFARFADWLEEQRPGDGDALARAYAHFALRQQTQYRLMFDLGQPQEILSAAQGLQQKRARDAMVAHARELVNRKLLCGEPELLGLILWSTLHGVVTLHLTGNLSAKELEQALSQTIRAVLQNRASAAIFSAQGRADDHPIRQNFSAEFLAVSPPGIMAG